MTYLIAFNIPQYTKERVFSDILYHYDCYPYNIKFHDNCNSKCAIIPVGNKYRAQIIIKSINKTTVGGVFLDLILADEETKSFLVNNKKTIYFKITENIKNNLSKSIKLAFEKYGTIERFNYNEKSLIGSVIFKMTESALKAKDELNQKEINGNIISIDFKNFDSTLSFFFQQIELHNEKMPTKNENDSSIFVFDIPEEFDEKTLRKIFENFNVIEDDNGVVFSTKYNYDSKITKYAIVTFESRSNAKDAIEKLNYTKYDGIPIRLVFADSDTIKILKTNKGKLLISNLDKDIDISDLHKVFENFGEVIECEMPSDEGVSRGYVYVQFRNENDAIQAKSDLEGASIDGKYFQIDFLEKPSPNDLEKKYLTEINNKIKNQSTQKEISRFQKLFIPDFSMFNKSDDNFFIYVNEKRIECSRLIASFFSPKIAYSIQNDESVSHFKIKIVSLYKFKSIKDDLVNFLVSLLKDHPTRSKIQQLIIKIVEQIISSTIGENFKKTIKRIIDECSVFLHGNIRKNDDYILNLIMLFEIFTQFGNDFIIQYAKLSLFQNMQNYYTIENDQVLYIKHSMRKIMGNSEDNYDEIEYISSNFLEINPQILNKIDSKTIKKSISTLIYNDKIGADQFLYKILRLNNQHQKKLIRFVDFEKVTNEAMKFFLSSIDFSFFNGKFLKSISKRLTLSLKPVYDEHINESSSIFSKFIRFGIENSLSKRNIYEKDFTIFFVNGYKRIDINSKIASIISPIIKRNLQTDITFSSFYLRVDSQIDSFNEFAQSFSYFISKEEKIIEFDVASIENKIFDLLTQMNNMIENRGINYLIKYLFKLNLEEKNSFNYIGWIFLFICLGNFGISEFLVNLFIKSYDQKINNIEDLLERIHHKEVLQYQNSFEVDISMEKIYIVNNFEDFFKNIIFLEDINENLWKILSIRLSVDAKIKSNTSNIYAYDTFSDSDIQEIA